MGIRYIALQVVEVRVSHSILSPVGVDHLTTFMIIPCGWSSLSNFKGFQHINSARTCVNIPPGVSFVSYHRMIVLFVVPTRVQPHTRTRCSF